VNLWPPALPSRRTIALVVVAVLVAAALGAGGWFWHATEQRQVTAVYATAMVRAKAARGPQATSAARTAAIMGLEAVLARYPSARSASQAAYELGNLKYESQQYDAARAAYEVALAREPTTTIRSLARAGIGYAWESERGFEKAAAAFQTALGGLTPKDFLYEDLLADLARSQERAGRKEQAIETYRRLLRDVPGTRRADDVRTRLASLGAAVP
jgi:tetratricopeptide (TPR) repeat protein